MRTIDGRTLRSRLAAGERLWLVHDPKALSFRHSHLPGAIAFEDVEQASRAFRGGDVVIVYGLDGSSTSSRALAVQLSERGSGEVHWYEGGLREWIGSGSPVEGALDPSGRRLQWEGGVPHPGPLGGRAGR